VVPEKILEGGKKKKVYEEANGYLETCRAPTKKLEHERRKPAPFRAKNTVGLVRERVLA